MRATVPVTALVTAGTALADVAVAGAGVAAAGAGGSVWVWGCDPAGWPGAAGPWPWVRLWVVWLTLASAPPAGYWPGPLPGAPDGACPSGVLGAAPPAAGPVLDPPDPPGMMSWVTPRTADTAALAAGALVTGALVTGALVTGALVAGALAARAGTWFAASLVPGGGAGTLAAGAAGEEAALAAGAWLAGAGPQNWAGRRAGSAAAVLGAGRRRTGPGCHCPVRGCCPVRGGAARPGEETLGRASHRTSRGCGAARQARCEPADARGCGGAGGLSGAWILR